MWVRAKEACFAGEPVARRRVGEEFEFHGKELPPYLVVVKSDDPKPEPPKAPQPMALSELHKSEPATSFIDSVKRNKK